VTDFDEADIAAMRKEGDLRGFLRDQLRAGRNRKAQQPEAKPPKPPGYRPGAWPTGARPPDPPAQRHPPAAWDAALDDYREWLTTADHVELGNRTDHRQTCGCAACSPRRTT